MYNMENTPSSRSRQIILKTSLDVSHIRKPCRIAEELLFSLNSFIRPGITTMDIEIYGEKFIAVRKGVAALKGYKGFPRALCISVNNIAAHGIGGSYVIQDGDVVTVDTTVGVDGWYGDAAWTYVAGSADSSRKRLVKAAWKSMLAGIGAARAGNRLGDIGSAVQRCAARHGCSVLEDLAGHGIGRDIHEEPVVYNFGKGGKGQPVVPGMVFTIEPILTLGGKTMKIHTDNWSIITSDSSLSAQFEATVAVFSQHTEVLTLNGINLEKYIDFPPMF